MHNTIIYSSIAGMATLVGAALVVWNEDRIKKYTVYLMSFAAGVMLGTAFFHLIPEACESSGMEMLLYVLLGFLSFYIIENVIMFHPCHDEKCEIHKLGTISFIGLFVHSLLDGVAIAVGFEVGHGIGVFTALAVILHEFPEGISVSGILLHSGSSKKRIYVNSSLVAAATPLGAILFGQFAKKLPTELLAILLAFTAGSFLYIAAADLIPESHKKNDRKIAAVLLAGVVLVYAVGEILHAH